MSAVSSLQSGHLQSGHSQKGSETFNPFLPEFRQNPYPTYHRLRMRSPVHRTASFTGAWLLTRYADVKSVLTDKRVKVDDLPERLKKKAAYLEPGQDFEQLRQTIGAWLFFQNPPDHGRFRNLVMKHFSISTVEALRPRIQKIVDRLIDQVIDQGHMDIMADVAAPLPTLVMSDLLGVPDQDRPQLTQWSYTLFRVFDQPITLKGYAQMEETAGAFKSYFRDLIRQRRQSPGSDLLSKLLVEKDNQKDLSEEDFFAFCTMLFSVGQETTENMIGNSLLALLHHHTQFNQLRQNPELISSALEELLRYDSPVQILARIAEQDLEIGGQTIQAGDRLFLALGAANRDPEQFSNPDELCLTRNEGRPIPFGAGIHHCLGGAIARVQGQVAINSILKRLPNLQRTEGNLSWRKNLVLRGLSSLPVTF